MYVDIETRKTGDTTALEELRSGRGGGGGRGGAGPSSGSGGPPPFGYPFSTTGTPFPPQAEMDDINKKNRLDNINKEITAQKHLVDSKKQDLRATKDLAAANLSMNMSLLGFLFGVPSVIKGINAFKDAEMQHLALKKNMTAEDKKRLENYKHEQIEMQKYMTLFQMVVSLMMVMMTINQFLISQKQRLQQAEMLENQTKLISLVIQKQKIKGNIAETTSEVPLQVAKAGFAAPAMAVLLVASIAAAMLGIMAFLPKAAGGAMVHSKSGGQAYIVGEGGQDEVISPIPQLREVFRSEIQRSGGGTTININAIDSRSFEQALARNDFANKLRGVA